MAFLRVVSCIVFREILYCSMGLNASHCLCSFARSGSTFCLMRAGKQVWSWHLFKPGVHRKRFALVLKALANNGSSFPASAGLTIATHFWRAGHHRVFSSPTGLHGARRTVFVLAIYLTSFFNFCTGPFFVKNIISATKKWVTWSFFGSPLSLLEICASFSISRKTSAICGGWAFNLWVIYFFQSSAQLWRRESPTFAQCACRCSAAAP